LAGGGGGRDYGALFSMFVFIAATLTEQNYLIKKNHQYFPNLSTRTLLLCLILFV